MKPNNNEPVDIVALRRQVILLILTVASLLGVVGTARSLSFGPFPTKGLLYATYFGYSLLVLAFLHFAVLTWNEVLKERGRRLWPNLPRYLEYVYATIISISLAQVLFMSSQFADFVTLAVGTKPELISKLSRQAELHLIDDCPKGGEFFTKAYCEKLKKIVDSNNPDQYITSIVIFDDEFLDHIIARKAVPTPPGASIVNIRSPISIHANAIRTLYEYSAPPQDTVNSRAFRWLAFLLLPLGIGIRILKTSVELFWSSK